MSRPDTQLEAQRNEWKETVWKVTLGCLDRFKAKAEAKMFRFCLAGLSPDVVYDHETRHERIEGISQHDTLLHIAAREGHRFLVRRLAGVDFNARINRLNTFTGENPIDVYLDRGHGQDFDLFDVWHRFDIEPEDSA